MATVRGADGDDTTIDRGDLEAAVRHGHLTPDTEVRFDPWTAGAFVRVRRIPELARFLDEPDARFAARLRSRPFPRTATVFTSLVVLFALVQQITRPKIVELGAAGWDACFLEGHWWAVWTAHFLHWPKAPLVHALGNAGYLAYCGYRVEQAWGPTGYAKVVAFSMASSTLFILFGEAVPVIGSSTIAFGLLGAQIAIGFRQDDSIPVGWRGVYGWGTAFAAALLVLFHVGLDMALTGDPQLASGVSHLAHAGGFIGGVIAILAGRTAVLAPPSRIRRAAAADLAAVVLALLLPVGIVLALPHAPSALGFPWRDDIPAHFADHPVTLRGLDGFVGAPGSEEPFFHGSALGAPEAVGPWWSRALGHDVAAIDAPDILGAPWQASAWDVLDDEQRRRIVELDRPDGDTVERIAWIIRGDDVADFGARERLYAEIARRIATP